MISLPDLQIHHDPAARRFEAQVAGGRAECIYRLQGSLMNIVYTEVPRQVEGQGVAGAMVEAALAHARAMGWQVRPSCGYVRAYMRRHPLTHDLLESR